MKKSIDAITLSFANESSCIDIIKVSEWLAYEEEFSNKNVDENVKRIRDLEERLNDIKSDFAKLKEAVREAEWKYFLTTLPVLPDSALSDKIIKLEDKILTWRDKGTICGLPYDVYSNKDENLHLFTERHYYLESEFDKPELVTREMMGYGETTKYGKNDDGTIKILGSGSINVTKMWEDHGRLITPYDDYENPIIDRGKKEKNRENRNKQPQK